jgi:holo-[acyl-carrier protein] synthase
VVGLGIDLVEVARMRTALERTPSIVDRVFTTAEVADAERGGDRAERYAARFAAKEAVLKALGSGLGSVSLRAIEVRRAESGAPSVHLHDGASELARRRGVGGLLVSLTHTATTAGAVVVATTGAGGTAAADGADRGGGG